jgi:hypothetical protein
VGLLRGILNGESIVERKLDSERTVVKKMVRKEINQALRNRGGGTGIRLVDNYNFTGSGGGAFGGSGGTTIGFRWLGAYDNGTAYVPYDVVSYNGSVYICVANTTGNIPTTDAYWDLFASKGDTGATGAAGADGQGFTWLGAYNGATAYVPYDVVEEDGSAYVCILASTGNTPPNGTYWELMASKGDTGATGPAGASSTVISNETPSGTKNSSNLVFTLANTPNPLTSTTITINGVRYYYTTHYTVSGTTLTMINLAPDSDDIFIAGYVY